MGREETGGDRKTGRVFGAATRLSQTTVFGQPSAVFPHLWLQLAFSISGGVRQRLGLRVRVVSSVRIRVEMTVSVFASVSAAIAVAVKGEG